MALSTESKRLKADTVQEYPNSQLFQELAADLLNQAAFPLIWGRIRNNRKVNRALRTIAQSFESKCPVEGLRFFKEKLEEDSNLKKYLHHNPNIKRLFRETLVRSVHQNSRYLSGLHLCERLALDLKENHGISQFNEIISNPSGVVQASRIKRFLKSGVRKLKIGQVEVLSELRKLNQIGKDVIKRDGEFYLDLVKVFQSAYVENCLSSNSQGLKLLKREMTALENMGLREFNDSIIQNSSELKRIALLKCIEPILLSWIDEPSDSFQDVNRSTNGVQEAFSQRLMSLTSIFIGLDRRKAASLASTLPLDSSPLLLVCGYLEMEDLTKARLSKQGNFKDLKTEERNQITAFLNRANELGLLPSFKPD